MINKKRIRSLNPYRSVIPASDAVFVSSTKLSDAQLARAGFTKDAIDGTTILPKGVGKITLYNAEGKYKIRRDMPMETAYRVVEWHWKQWDGSEHSAFKDVPYKRYPREFISPPSLEITLAHNTAGEPIALTGEITGWKEDNEKLIHAINVFLELFGECIVLDEKKEEVLPHDIHRVNWRILPKGEFPFSRVHEELKPVINRNKPGKRSFIDKRLERLNSFKPEFTVIGQGGFTGYVIMAYPTKNVYILESILYGNATYVLEKEWKEVSQLTKAEILQNSLHKQRIIHRENWFAKIKDLFTEDES